MPGHHFSKSWQYLKTKFAFDREGLTIYGGRHTRAGWYDALGLPQRIRNILLGHAPRSVAEHYGAIKLTTEEKALVSSAKLAIEEQIAEILLTAKLKANDKQLAVVKTWLPENTRPKLERRPLTDREPTPTGGS